jgi:hypothetical protein
VPTDTIRFPAPDNENMPGNVLSLSAYEVLSVEHDDHDYHVNARKQVAPANVPSAMH